MKFKHKIRQPKKPKKVTLARIREIMKEELASFTQIPKINFEGLLSNDTHDGEESKPMYFPPVAIKPVPPPPRVSAKKIADLPPIALPNEFEVEEEEI